MPITTQATSPYFDDFITNSVESKNYQSILFKPGYSVQNRELNQLQSMVRSQIDKFGSAFYTNGASVVDGLVTFNKDLRYVDIETTAEVASTIKTLKNTTTGVKADVVGYELLTGTVNTTYRFFIRYRTSSSVSSYTTSGFVIGDDLYSTSDEDGSEDNVLVDSAVAVGYAVGAFANKGVFFVNGSFALNEAQSTFLAMDNENSVFNGFVAFKITESIVTVTTDNTLYDNTTGAPNFSAPGADRQAITLELLFIASDATPTYDFAKLLIIVDSEAVRPARPASNSSDANSLDDILATRTFDESGNYCVRPFKLAMREHYNDGTNFGKYTDAQLAELTPPLTSDESKAKYVARIEPSVAYVKGYRVALTNRKDLVGNKARTFETIENVSFTAQQGNYILTTGMSFANNTSLPDICNSSLTFGLYATETGGGTFIGTCRIRNIEYVSATVFQVFIYDLVLNDSYNLLSAKCLALDGATGTGARFTNSAGFALYNSGNNTNIFKFPYNAIKSVTSLRYRVRKFFAATTTAASFVGPDGPPGTTGKWINIPHPTGGPAGPAGKFESSALSDYIVIDHVASTAPIPVTIEFIDESTGLWLLVPTATASQTVSVIAPYVVVTGTINAKSVLTAATPQTVSSATYSALTGRAVTFTITTERVGLASHGLLDGDRVSFTSITTTTGIYPNIAYYVINKTTNDFQLSLRRGGTAIGLNTGNGTGVMSSNNIVALNTLDIVASSVVVKHTGRSVGWIVLDDKVTLTAHGLVNGDKVSFTALGTATGISTGVTYYVVNKTTDDFQLSLTSGGSVINITGANTTGGTMDSVVTGFSVEDGSSSSNHFDTPLLVYTSTTPLTGPLTITHNYYPHTAATGLPYTVDSYSSTDLEDVPLYQGTRLSDCIDFRFDNHPTAAVRIDSNSTIVATVERYLPRIDNVLVNSSGKFYIAEGSPSLNPIAPPTPGDSMSLYSLYVPAYTYSTDEILPRFVDNKRYTMRDIGDIEKRVANIEYYTSLSLLERSAQDKQILTAGGLERYKNGILVDSFFGHNIADIENTGHKCSIDQVNGVLRPYYTTTNLDLKIDSTVGEIDSNDNTTFVAYTHAELIKQSFATANAESVNPFDMQVWNGSIELSPSSDEWKSTTVRPEVIVNDTSAYDAIAYSAEQSGILGYHWNEWEVNWSGIKTTKSKPHSSRAPDGVMRQSITTTAQSTSIREGTRTTLSYTDTTQSIGEKVVDISYIPFIRSRKVYFKATKLKPNTRVYPFFDGVDISDYIVSTAFVPFKEQTDSTIYDGNDDPLGLTPADTIVSDSTGKASGYFIIPNNSSLKFNTGERSFRLIDSDTNSDSDFTTLAEATYHASGLLETKQNTILSTRVAKIDTARVTESRTNADVVKVKWVDPLAQSFILDRNQLDGAYVTKLDLYFKTKSTKKVPVSVHIVSMENGMPTQNVLPFSEVVLDASAVTVSSDASAATTFTFSSPVYLQPGVEYAFVVTSNDSDYTTYVSEVGKENIGKENIVDGNTQIIAKNPYAGVLFKSQNGSTWSADQAKDMMFTLYRASFDTSATSNEVVLQGLNTVDPTGTLSFSSLKTTVETISQNNTQILWKLTITDTVDGEFVYDGINVNETLDFDRRFTTLKDGVVLTAYLSTDTEYLSPYIDNDRISVLLVDNLINSDVTNETVQDKGSAAARYITRSVDLNNSANQLNIYIGANRPTASENILVYAKAQTREEGVYENAPWVLLSPTTIIPVSSNTNSYSEIAYTYSPAMLFSRFSVKIVLTSTNTNGANVPSVKDFRAIATYGA